jgi:hypothetical protein
MSIVKFNRWKWSDGTNRNHIVQSVTASSTTVAGWYSNVTSDLTTTPGTANQFASNPTSTQGLQLLTTTFQPKFADSWILLQSSQIDVSEYSNNSDDVRIYAHAGTTLLGSNMASIPYESMGGSLNAYNMTLMVVANSWGTDSRTIRLGMSSTNNTSTAYWYVNQRYLSNHTVAPYNLTITEIAK